LANGELNAAFKVCFDDGVNLLLRTFAFVTDSTGDFFFGVEIEEFSFDLSDVFSFEAGLDTGTGISGIFDTIGFVTVETEENENPGVDIGAENLNGVDKEEDDDENGFIPVD
jgi:hypothetical protein